MKRYNKISCDSFYSQFQLYFFSNSPLLYTFPIEQLNCLLFDYFRFKISWKLTCQTLAEFKSIFFSKIFSSNNLKVWNCIQHKFIWWQVLLLHIAKGKQTQWNWYFIFYIYFLSFFPAGVGWPLYCMYFEMFTLSHIDAANMIIVEDAGFEPGAAASATTSPTNELWHRGF